MPISAPRIAAYVAGAFFAAAAYGASGANAAMPISPAPAIGPQIVDIQYKVRAAPRRAVVTTRPVRPMVRPVRPGVRPGRPIVVQPGRPVVRPGRPVVVAPRYYGRWSRPYRWRPGGAIAAGAAIGFIGAAAAAAYYSSPPPADGLCWYYTNPARTNGFWDVCPY